jgi:hypothetical protein
MGRVPGGMALILCSGTRPPLPEGDDGDKEGVDEFELSEDDPQPGDELLLAAPPRPDPGRFDRSQALYCSFPRPDPGRVSLENAALDSCAAITSFLKACVKKKSNGLELLLGLMPLLLWKEDVPARTASPLQMQWAPIKRPRQQCTDDDDDDDDQQKNCTVVDFCRVSITK